ncbi:DUF3617 domain-containing protein [Mangrovitalea sediminis]|uniref:DUF3617 domain-containing protein n=1 Tax=Mangrovitalea sediminis TaxID=1982043 RepID=UPI000BE523D2|nr:DUF3617 family protein [Mangrovitalea sediminis]
MRRWLILGAAVLPFAAAAQSVMTPGEWQQTIHVQMPGSTMTMPAHTVKQCVKPQAASSVESYLKQTQQPSCHMDDYSTKGNKTHWKVTCSGQQTSTTEGVFTMENPKAYTIHMTTTMKTPAGDFSTKVTTEGKWLGACP